MIGQLLTGRYLVLKKLGGGGFSETFLARDKYLPHHPLCVVKRLKLSPNSTISAETSQRLFDMEAHILDQLGQQHDQIPTLFAYCHEQEQIYQVQEYIEGENFGNWIARKRCLTPKAAIELLSDVLPILEYIHARQVIHRDIKPSNLIRHQRDGKTVLIDFGAAHLLSDPNSVKPDEELLLAIGTPGYMPIEQQEGTSQFNSDLYALGMSVIHLLTGANPKQFQPDLISGELDWQTSLKKPLDPKFTTVLDRLVRINPRDRYQQASDALAALEALSLEGQPRRWLPTSKGLVRRMLKPAAAIVLVSGLIGGWRYYQEPAGVVLERLGGIWSGQPKVRLTLLHNLRMQTAIDRMLIAPNSQILITAGADRVLRLWSLSQGTLLRSLLTSSPVTALGMSRDSRFLVSGSADRTVRLWDVDSGKLLREFKAQSAITAAAIDPDAQTVVAGGKDGTLRLWDLQTGTLRQTLKATAEVTAVTYGAPDRLISASSDRQLQVWDAGSGQLRRTFSGHTSTVVGLQAVDDQTVMSFSKDQMLVWNLQREELVRVFSGKTTALTALLDDEQMISVDDDGSLRIWTRKTGWQSRTIAGKWRNLQAAISSNYRYLVCWSPDQKLRVWQVSGME